MSGPAAFYWLIGCAGLALVVGVALVGAQEARERSAIGGRRGASRVGQPLRSQGGRS